MTWELVYTKPAQRDTQKPAASGLKEKTKAFCWFYVKIHSKIHRRMKYWLEIYPERIPGGSTFGTVCFIKFCNTRMSLRC